MSLCPDMSHLQESTEGKRPIRALINPVKRGSTNVKMRRFFHRPKQTFSSIESGLVALTLGPGSSAAGSRGPRGPVCCWASSGTPEGWIPGPPRSPLPVRLHGCPLTALWGTREAAVSGPILAGDDDECYFYLKYSPYSDRTKIPPCE